MTPSSSTPTPWEFKDGLTASIVGANGETVCDDEAYYPTAVSVDDMKLIVLAVNSHAALTKERDDLRRALEQLDALLDFGEPCDENKPLIFEDWTQLNEAFAEARLTLESLTPS